MFAKDLAKLIRTLATLEPAEAPVVSCYLDLAERRSGRRDSIEHRARLLEHVAGEAWREPFEDAMQHIRAYLDRCLNPISRGVAIFARGGSNAMFLPIQSPRRFPDRLVVNSTPDLFELLSLEDHTRSYIVTRVGGCATSVFEVRLGATTRPIWSRCPCFRSRFVRQLGRVAHGRRGPDDGDVQELAALLSALIAAHRPEGVLLDGSGRTAKRIVGELRENLAPGPRCPASREVLDGLRTAVAEFEPAPDCVETLRRQLLVDGLAAAGTPATIEALMERQLDLVVMARSYRPDPGWVCRSCWAIAIAPEQPRVCPECGRAGVIRFDVREDMLRAARALGCRVEEAEDSGLVGQLGGVGALLRHTEPGVRYREAA